MSKELKVSDQSRNSYNMRVLTSGGDFDRFKKNPIMLFNHRRYYDDRDPLPIGTWEGFRIQDQEIFATPKFDTGDKFAAEIGRKFDEGIVKSASMGIQPIEVIKEGEDEKGYSQYLITKWELREISICDIPSNKNTVALYDQEDELLNNEEDILSFCAASVKQQPKIQTTTAKDMDVKLFAVSLGLSADANQEQVNAKILELKGFEAKNVELSTENAALKAKIKEHEDAKVLELVDQAIKDKKILPNQKDQYIKMFDKDFEGMKSIVDSLQPQVKLSDIPQQKPVEETGDNGIVKYEGMTFSEMQKKASGKLAHLKQSNFELFCQMYKSEFGSDFRA